jgi:hypothetical protein
MCKGACKEWEGKEKESGREEEKLVVVVEAEKIKYI